MRRIKHILSLAALLLCCISVSAEDFSVGGIYYSITSEEEQTVKVTYQGSYYDSYKDEYLGTVTIPATVTYNGTTYQVAEIGKSAFHSCSSLTDIIIPEGVTSIGSNAFSKCGELSHITIPSSVTSIGNFCFSSCYNLKSVVFEDGDETLLLGNCKYSDGIGGGLFEDLRISDVYVGRNLKFSDNNDSYYRPYTNAFFAYWWATSYPIVSTVTIGPRVTELPNYMFQDCKDLTVITCMAEKVPTCYSSSFKTVRKDEGVDLGKCILYVPAGSVDAYKAAEYWKEFTNIQPIPTSDIASGTCGDNLTWRLTEEGELTIKGTGNMYFETAPWKEYKNEIKSVIILEGVTSVENHAFSGCSSITSVTIPEGVRSIGEYAFYGCTSLPTITIPEGVTEIGGLAFAYCRNLNSITIAASVTEIGVYAFYECSNLTAVYISNIEAWCNILFNSNPLSSAHNLYLNGELVTKLVIPDNVTSIGESAFSGCSSLTSVTIPMSATKIGGGAFYGCTSLTSVTIPESVTEIGGGAFAYCSNLTSITIPEGVNEIRANTFHCCSSLTTITIPEGVTKIEDGAFGYCSSLTSITSHAATPPTAAPYTFYEVDKSIPVYVPAESVDAYKAASYWSAFSNIQPIEEPIPTVTITISKYGSGTYSSEYALDFSEVKVLKAYVATGYNHLTGEVTLLRVRTAQAATGLLIKGTPGVSYEVPIIESTADHTLNMLVATLEKTPVNSRSSDGLYANYKYTVVKEQSPEPMFYEFEDGSNLSAGKAYLQIPLAWLPTTGQKSIRYRFEEGETTDIEETPEFSIQNSELVYDLYGRRVLSPKKGELYIINNKKVVY